MAPATRVLVVDDEPMVREVLARYLEKEGFSVQTAEDGEQALAAFGGLATRPVLPGPDAAPHRRARGVPLDARADPPAVIMLTAKGEEARSVRARVGADDYVTKPFSPREVVARVRAVLRRTAEQPSATPDVVTFGDVAIDGPRREVRRGDEPVHLTRKEFDLLALLASNPGRTFTRAELLDEVWDFAWDGDTATVTVHVRRLREKIEEDPSNPTHLVTVWGVGYRFEA
jgi:DNA-binding response OmpR family regulator